VSQRGTVTRDGEDRKLKKGTSAQVKQTNPPGDSRFVKHVISHKTGLQSMLSMDASIAFILAYKVVSDDGVENTTWGVEMQKPEIMNTDLYGF